jgi:hypothetical protein
MKKSIKSLNVRVIPNGKKQGRPSKFEYYMSEMMSKIADSKEFKDEVSKCIEESCITGKGMFDASKIKI